MQKNIKDSIIHIIENAGHLSNMENTKEFNYQLINFLLTIKPDYNEQEKTNNSEWQTLC